MKIILNSVLELKNYILLGHTSPFIYIIDNACFRIIITQLTSGERDHMPHKTWNFYPLTFSKKTCQLLVYIVTVVLWLSLDKGTHG